MKYTLSILAAALCVCGCSKQENLSITNPQAMSFVAEYPMRTSATAFEGGDNMGVFVTQYDGTTPAPLQLSGNYANNVSSIFNGATWVMTPKIYWAEGRFDVYAYYPYTEVTSVDELPFTVALDQSVEAANGSLSAYEASDFLWAKTTDVKQKAEVSLSFKHCMSKLVVRLVKGADYEGDLPADAVVTLHNTVPHATIDLATGIVTKNGYEATQSITAKKVADDEYVALVVPQRLETKRPMIEILSKGVSYLIESSFVFKAGTQHTITVTLNSNPEKVKIEIGGEIEGNWD